MLRPGLHFGNACEITDADLDLIRRWAPLSLLEAMDNVVPDSLERLRHAWELAGHCDVVLRRYYVPREGNANTWGAHALETVAFARKVVDAGIPVRHLIAKPFNEPNMPRWAQWEGFGPEPEDQERYNHAVLIFVDQVKNAMPELRIGGPHLTVGNRDVKFPNNPPGYYYYHGPDLRSDSSICHEALQAFDVHFVHCYGLNSGEYRDRAHGLRFLEYEKYLRGKPIYNVESGCAINSPEPWTHNRLRGQETADYLRLLGDHHPQVKGIAFFIGGDRGWDAFRHSDGSGPGGHRPVVTMLEEALNAEPNGGNGPDPTEGKYKLLKGLSAAGIATVADLRGEIETFSDVPRLWEEHRTFDRVRYVVFHHSGRLGPHTGLDIARWHVLEKPEPRDPTTPYHFTIYEDGLLEFDARLIWTTYHSGRADVNRHAVGVCLLGDFTREDPTVQQIDTARRLIYALNEFFGGGWHKFRGLYLVPHGLVTDTQCPGRLVEDLICKGDWPVPHFFCTNTAHELLA
jgi:hypothetical protein